NTMNLTVADDMCVNGRTLYTPTRDGRHYRHAVLVSGGQALDILTIDPATGEFRRERFSLSPSAYAAATQAAGPVSPDSCTAPGARAGVTRRTEALQRFAEGQPVQRQVWSCTATGR